MESYNVIDEANGFIVLFTGSEEGCYRYISQVTQGKGNGNLKVRPV